MSDYLVQFNNISKFFGKVIALKDVTMKLRKGEIMCLLGDNGAGKSTLIKTLAGVHKPDEGEIIVEGKKIKAGVDAFICIWSELGYFKLLGFFIRLPIIYQLACIFYRLFANFRFKNLSHCQIIDKQK